MITTQTVWEELEATAGYDDRHGVEAATVLASEDAFSIVEKQAESFETSRIDAGEASCVAATRTRDTPFLLTDDYRALPELQELVEAEVMLSPIVLRALVKRGTWSEQRAKTAFVKIVEGLARCADLPVRTTALRTLNLFFVLPGPSKLRRLSSTLTERPLSGVREEDGE